MSESAVHKVFDAHVHVGYFPRLDGKGGDVYYYSPARLLQYMRWAGVDEFVFSSTNACWDAHAEAMHPEAMEVLRLAALQGLKAHPFFWVSRDYLKWDGSLDRLPAFYEGIKLHGAEARWTKRSKAFRRILAIARERGLPVQIHTGNDDLDGCAGYLPYCREFPAVRMDLAHGHYVQDAVRALRECPNVWVDVSFMELDEVKAVWAVAPGRVMYGSDFPAPLRYWNTSCTEYMRRRMRQMRSIGGDGIMSANARAFLQGSEAK